MVSRTFQHSSTLSGELTVWPSMHSMLTSIYASCNFTEHLGCTISTLWSSGWKLMRMYQTRTYKVYMGCITSVLSNESWGYKLLYQDRLSEGSVQYAYARLWAVIQIIHLSRCAGATCKSSNWEWTWRKSRKANRLRGLLPPSGNIISNIGNERRSPYVNRLTDRSHSCRNVLGHRATTKHSKIYCTP